MRRVVGQCAAFAKKNHPTQQPIHECATNLSAGSRRWSSTVASKSDGVAAAPLISGIPGRLVRNSVDTTMKCTDFVGNPSAGNQLQPQRLAGGEMLGLMDVTAAGVALHHVTGKRFQVGAPAEAMADGSATAGSAVSVATIGVDNTCFVAPVLHGDVVEMTGRVVHAGSSSMGVFIQAHRLPFLSSERTLVAEAFFSMVAIDSRLRAAKVVPAVALSTSEEKTLHARYAEIREAQNANLAYFVALEQDISNRKGDIIADLNTFVESGGGGASAAAVHESGGRHSTASPSQLLARVPVSHTVTEANRHFSSSHLNINNTIFGGEILRWMEAHATYCGRKFARNRHVYSIGMHSVSFNQPIFPTDWVSLRARVALTRKATIEVDVRLTVEREGSPLMTNRASFVLINTDEVGRKCPLTTGISLEGEEERVIRHVAMAKHRFLHQQRVYAALKHYKR